MSFFGEFRRRNVFRMGVAYLAAVWVLIEVANTIVPIINAPPWAFLEHGEYFKRLRVSCG